ncbi:hypothetical protein CTI12_AA315630 [Artemisia annua]|uniref:MSP domain-containing protein n=1 Tax=Artemisia annua TaxID=35608 RepID=A0A2U1N2F1_ARTAN|nr:hypothetical protein CTI12_AA315630 [Artemisia annua]
MEPSTKDDDFGEIRPQELKFMLEPKTQISCHVNWFNKSNRYMAFKVKVTNPKIYCVRPRVGIVKPYSKCQVQVTRQALDVVPPSNVVITKDKFLFQRAFVDKDISISDVSSIFRSTEGGKYINETKLKVVLDFTKAIKMEMGEGDSKVKEYSDIEILALSLKKANKTLSKLKEQKYVYPIFSKHWMGFSKPDQIPVYPTNWAAGGPGIQAVFPYYGQKSYGTGVFIPRTAGNVVKKQRKSACLGDVHKVERPFQWCPPDVGSLKFNVDGSAQGKPGLAGIGGLLRNSEGVVIAQFSIPVGVMDSGGAEVLAMEQACKMVNKKDEFKSVKIIIESDYLCAVSWVHCPNLRPGRFLPHFKEIDSFFSSCSGRSIVHVYREYNYDADKLAKDGVHRASPLSLWMADLSQISVESKNKNLRVIPTHGDFYSFVRPLLTRQAQDIVPLPSVIANEKFLFQRAFVDKNKSIDDVKSLLRAKEGDKCINETELKVVLDVPKEVIEDQELEIALQELALKLKNLKMWKRLYTRLSKADTDDFGEIQPQELRFRFKPKTQISCIVKLTNKSSCPMAFKVKVSDVKMYCARPVVGIIKPHSICQVQLTRQAQDIVPLPSVIANEKFLFQRAFVDKNKSIDDVKSLLRAKEGDKCINETELKVVLDVP